MKTEQEKVDNQKGNGALPCVSCELPSFDDWMVCLSTEDSKAFEKEFNEENKQSSAPDWYMQVEGEPKPIDLNDKQFSKLQTEKRVWLSVLNAL